MSTRHPSSRQSDSADQSTETGIAVAVRSEHPEGAYAVRILRNMGRRFLEALGESGELSILVTTDRDIQELNRQWRQKNAPTDVLSFPQEAMEEWEQPDDIPLLGDVVISLDTARRQAREGRRPQSQELARLLAHGLLHLLGYDHERPADARRMAQAEMELLGAVGLVAEALALHPADLEVKRARKGAPKAHRDSPRSPRTPARESATGGGSGSHSRQPSTSQAPSPRTSSQATATVPRSSGSRRVTRKESPHVRALYD